jgi:preprotein translocase subunit SecE
MALNREQKRALKKSGELGEDGTPAPRRSQGGSRSGPPPKDKEKRTSAREYLREVRAEMRKVAWPNREETRNYSLIVLVALVVMTTFIFVIDLGFSDVVLRLFKAK